MTILSIFVSLHQGELMRKILFAAERVSTDSKETFYFIGALVAFALIASSVVLYQGLHDESRNQFKLILHCIMIVTSVVPPELPMELSLAVTHSLAALSKAYVYCTEPFRIPFAGQVNVLCFDKTGTLTKDKMLFRGLVAAQQDICIDGDAVDTTSNSTITEVQSDLNLCSNLAVAIMGTCHALFRDTRNGKIIGFDF
jgi:cation-transporting ATPase 13A1